jgi:hypothetical protein
MNSAIEKFCELTGFVFENDGTIGFGRHAVGIVNTQTESYVAYEHRHPRTHELEDQHEVACNTQPQDAYHKGPYLAVLHDGTFRGRVDAIAQLEKWIENIMTASYEIKTFKEINTLAALAAGGCVDQKYLGGGMNYEEFQKISQK